ncbi:hypothetical protein Fleli_0401 [Bernardetia litoralis DSM 6794]|uniref:DUF3592 domain-containing protein n=1 Tax=Bernardetia litoralis (strain ATCC 23117 / DSM 6794 / NBRC 15988 / NCIMB 1366 / Fx l1 / Sio-4) TaxID=880071 RepID=I4AFZ2_BERLS|nr:hypothetical protein [Bernardetia litoralis]AFM02877.1 hypothetical protein Fleli_0401 [Bernardetia litoralis DSM 6794]
MKKYIANIAKYSILILMLFIFFKTISNDIPSSKLINEGIFIIAEITKIEESGNIYPVYEYTFKIREDYYTSTSLNNSNIDMKLGDKFWTLVLKEDPQNSTCLVYKGKINNMIKETEIDRSINMGKIILGSNYSLPLFLLVIAFILFPYLISTLFRVVLPRSAESSEK